MITTPSAVVPTPDNQNAVPAVAAVSTSPPPTTINYRMEHDLIGDEKVPRDAYYGIQTQRA